MEIHGINLTYQVRTTVDPALAISEKAWFMSAVE
jgi:hypothetical protein